MKEDFCFSCPRKIPFFFPLSSLLVNSKILILGVRFADQESGYIILTT